MQECFAFYETTDVPMLYRDLAFVFECSNTEVRQVMRNTHPALLGIFIPRRVDRKTVVAGPKRPVGRPRKVTTDIPKAPKKDNHCHRGHEFTKENTYTYKASGHLRRKCRQCRDKYGQDYYEKKSTRLKMLQNKGVVNGKKD